MIIHATPSGLIFFLPRILQSCHPFGIVRIRNYPSADQAGKSLTDFVFVANLPAARQASTSKVLFNRFIRLRLLNDGPNWLYVINAGSHPAPFNKHIRSPGSALYTLYITLNSFQGLITEG